MSNPLTTFEGAELGREVCRGRIALTQEEIDRFCSLMGYDDAAFRAGPSGGGIAPTSMCLAFGLRLGWEEQVFPPGVIRVGDENTYGVPARAGDVLTTTLVITDRFERKGRRFLTYEMVTTNQVDDEVCKVRFTAILP
ncbi:MaoC family dehydratase [Pseudohoeflea coraliihabitans]|uniref:MaoC family dehydratase n=1 Tax=Pseudohoeflea coraliihabitans TaxID=2860393 RepID=A0ABS6WJ52_9HYPH|nr:MaoC family dehydratase [Pseudohoeflea sp. DP4N28-3]MBW3095978.1 MaoC family dehydratase [Pseudohoeflea sp. DP4N28-3]